MCTKFQKTFFTFIEFKKEFSYGMSMEDSKNVWYTWWIHQFIQKQLPEFHLLHRNRVRHHWFFSLSKTGVKQGCIPLSQTRLHHFEENELVDLDFADNIALAVEPFEDLQALTANLEKVATNNGLNISQDETNDMVMHQRDSIRNNNQIKIKDKPVKSVEKLKYIVSVISANGNINDDINMKIGETAVNFKKMNKIWQFTLFSIRLQIVPFHSNVFPCLFECKWNMEEDSRTFN